MASIRKWLSDNSAALKGAAAFLAIVSLIPTALSSVTKFFVPDVTMRYNVDASTIPPDLGDLFSKLLWNKGQLQYLQNIDLDSMIHRLSILLDQRSAVSSNKPESDLGRLYRVLEFLNALAEMKRSLPTETIEKLIADDHAFDKMTLAISNNTKEVVSGIKIRVGDVQNFWGSNVNGSFLRPAEIEELKAHILEGYRGQTIVLPEIDDLPPDSSIELELYGGFWSFSTPQLTTAGQSHVTRKIIEMEEPWWSGMLTNPFYALLFIYAVIFGGLLIFLVARVNIRRQVLAGASGSIFYDAACKASLNGKHDEAMIFLGQAVERGYSNRQHMTQDDDLAGCGNSSAGGVIW
jgi:hypothetical protein